MAETRQQLNLRDAVVPISVIVAIVGGALVIQARLLSVEYAVDGLKQWIERRDAVQEERLRMFAAALKHMNPNLNVPEVR